VSAKFTPGPWSVWPGPAYVGGGEDLCIGAGKTWLANMDHRRCQGRDYHFRELADCKLEPDSDICSFTNEITEEQRANARLIAAAPDLYALLVECAQADDDQPLHHSLRRDAEDLIAKIEGRS